ncbi:phosphodiester glycosidase family protein [Parerythrobacter aestuarii]|uniref:phosphodiester glycosidase family protein n=1 Tax=Parerythrobacter aestuarii TaxID=3020909 RepID=UPI0024DE0659|nr:phosphodiester glycosidase family protein [Parerythrobacter aestuarii]
MRTVALPLLLVLGACGQQAEGEPVTVIEFGENGATTTTTTGGEDEQVVEAAVPADGACEKVTYQDVPLTHCIADPARHRITTMLGSPYRSFAKLAEARGDSLPVFAMNGGMFDGEGKPIGYYVEKGERTKELNTADGPGNFHLKPNGVFYGTEGAWRVRSTDSFLANVSDRPQFGTQSGPMLLIEGKMHPEITDDGPSRQIRNGVGVDREGRAHFVISDGPISFGKFARFFRDVADTPNALFLDGNVSSLWDPASGRMDARAPIGPMIVVETK